MTQDTIAPKSWTHETMAEHVHTIATMLLALDYAIDSAMLKRMEGDIEQARKDLWTKMNDQGLRIIETATHRAVTMADGKAYVTRRES